MKRYILLLLLFVQGMYAQVEFKAVPSKTSLGINERLIVEFSVNADGDNFTPPQFPGFKVSGPYQTVSNSWINGKTSFSKGYKYLLIPTAKGSFTIGSATIEVDGKELKTAPLKIKVGEAIAGADPNPYANNQQHQQEMQQNTSDGVHLVAEVSKTNPYVNEPVTVVYKIYVSPSTSVSGWKEVASPQYNDFWSQNIDIKNLQLQQETYQGKMYRMVVLRKTVLYPQKDGRLEIEPLTLDVSMEVPNGRTDFFGRQFMVATNKVVSAGKKYINARPLPEKGKPGNFSGAVGNFSFTVKPSKTTSSNGEPIQLEVAVAGKGNLKLFTLPKPQVPAALEMYDPEHTESVTTPLTGMQGKIVDNYTIVPQNKGKYPIKELSFSWFDLGTQSYKTVTHDEIMINVLNVPANQESAAKDDTNKRTVTSTEPFRFIALETTLKPVGRDDFFGSGIFYGLLALPFLLIPFIIFGRKKKEAYDSDVVGSKKRENNKLAKKYLGEAKKQLGSKAAFYLALEKALHNFLKAKLNIETSEMSRDNIKELLLSRNAKEETVLAFSKIMDSCEFARYAPSSDSAMQQDYDSAVSVITALEKQI
ncbi:BatD family protein [Flavobacterium sp. DG1-102-2]|uniref:BatD family protein n=1 Tax=Flavobacterium sp. DG1-102-2 TaxID=3081663 RepID=UPI00294988EE|nr:BatD family protein [Flavobacterium sp. DG1-102-2]MDV6167823.1 BatD family protein [Flavobacterium sp. DG1-102-2]